MGGHAPLWSVQSALFSPLDSLPFMDRLWSALQGARPLTGRQRQHLPQDIAALSRLLTSERHNMAGYWARPAFVSAYLYYFLPWNILRLAPLLAALPLPEPKNISQPLIMDAGAGPLTATLALWLARPDLRALPLHVRALDSALAPMRIGKDLFTAIVGGACPWKIHIHAGPLETLGRHGAREEPWLVMAANVLNECKTLRPGRAAANGENARISYMAALLAAWLPPEARTPLLFVEPGTRLGGLMISALRECAIEEGFYAHAPCAHNNPCPLAKRGGSWCHFVFSARQAPQWLADISRKAGLYKTALSMSPLLLSRRKPQINHETNAMPCRVISHAFAARDGLARYGCAPCGLALLPDAENMPPGSLCLARKPARPMRDAKSGAIILEPFAADAAASDAQAGSKTKSKVLAESSVNNGVKGGRHAIAARRTQRAGNFAKHKNRAGKALSAQGHKRQHH